MIDLGIFNFIKNEFAKGESKEAVTAILLKKGMTQEDITAAFETVEHGATPEPPTHPLPGVTSSPTTTNSSSAFQSWNEFRGIFWKYVIGSFLVQAVASLVRIQTVDIGLTIVSLVLQLLIAIAVYRVAQAISGKRHIFLSIIAFFVPSAAYYYVYRIAKKTAPDLSLSIFEWIYVIFGLILYFLIIFLTIGSIIALAFVFTNNNHQVTKTGTGTNTVYTSNNSVVDKSNAASIRSDLDSIRVESALYYDDHSSYGTSSDCYAGGVFTQEHVVMAIKDIIKHSPYVPVCRSKSNAFVIQEQYIENNEYWCVDSTGSSLEKTQPLSKDAYSCK